MSDVVKRYPVGLNDEQLAEIDELKKEQFYSNSYSELFRYIIDLGLAKARELKEAK